MLPRCYAVGGCVLLISLLTWRRYRTARHRLSSDYALLITGCDSGLGFTLAVYAHRLGLTVFATCLAPEGNGAKLLREQCGNDRMHIVPLDVTSEDSVGKAVQQVRKILGENDAPLELKALVNNAAVMVFGEFEWQTERQMRQQVEVNLLGTMRVTKAFASIIRHYQGRIVTVISHCAIASLPGLAVYGATKGALSSWAESLRVEQAKYGVPVITLIPGSFVGESGIMSRHGSDVEEMAAAMSEEDKRFYGNYFCTYHSYLMPLSKPNRPPAIIQSSALCGMFEEALLARHPRHNYTNGPLRYTIYHFLFGVTPTWLRDWLVVRFMMMPKYTSNTRQI